MFRRAVEFPKSSRDKVYQLIISRLDGLRIGEQAYRKKQYELVEKGIGGFILFGGRREEIKAFISELQSRSAIPLFITSDVERGVGQQVEGLTSFPSQMAFVAACDLSQDFDVELMTGAIGAVAAEAADTGINMPLIPVMDVNRNPDNPIICTRAFSDDPEKVAGFGSVFIKTLEGTGLISCAKHFPGHGDTSTDSHISLPEIRKGKKDLYDFDISPFERAIAAGVGSIMVGHLSVPEFDVRPASISRRIITELLKEELGFKGLVLTDALNMHALMEYGDAALECLKAGADILLHPEDADSTAAGLLSALKDNRLDPGILDAAAGRIMTAKRNLFRKFPKELQEIDTKKNSAVSREISMKAVTLVRNSRDLLPIGQSGKFCAVLSGDKKLCESSLLNNINTPPDGPAGDEILLIAIFTSIAAWHGSSGIDDEEQARLNKLISDARKSIVVSFGSPYVLRHFPEADALIAAYDSSLQAQKSAVDCLKGMRPFYGKLPVRIPGVPS